MARLYQVVVTMALHHKELLDGLQGVKFEGNLMASEEDALFSLVKDFARVVCSVLKDYLASSSAEKQLDLMRRIRRLMKLVFHKPCKVTCKSFHRVLADLSALTDLLATSETAEEKSTSVLQRFSERLLFKLALSDSVHVAEAVRRVAQYQLTTETSVHQEETRVMTQAERCLLCARELVCLFLSTKRGPVCVSCWLNDKDASCNDHVTRLVSTLPHETPVPATHLLTHQRNLWENKTGTRHARLPDQRHAVISTAVHHLVRRRDKKDRTSVVSLDDFDRRPQARTETLTDSSSLSRTPIV